MHFSISKKLRMSEITAISRPREGRRHIRIPARERSSESLPSEPYATIASNLSSGTFVARSNTYFCAPPYDAFVMIYSTFLRLGGDVFMACFKADLMSYYTA